MSINHRNNKLSFIQTIRVVILVILTGCSALFAVSSSFHLSSIFQSVQVDTRETAIVSNVTTTSSATTTTTSTSSVEWDTWLSRTPGCFELHNVCHSANRWFYLPRNFNFTSGMQLRLQQPQQQQQVVVRLDSDPKLLSYRHMGYRNEITIDHLPSTVNFHKLRCIDAPLPHHIILFSAYNNMLGEFYDRALVSFWRSMSFFLPPNQTLADDNYFAALDAFLRQTQLYLHLDDPASRLLESHHVFSGVFRAHPLLDLTVLLHSTGCECLPRVAFCGYKKKKQYKRSEKSQRSMTGTTVLIPTDEYFTEWIDGGDLADKSPTIYADLQNVIRQRLISDNPFVQRDIETYRRMILSRYNNNTKRDLSQWKIVGLTQRSGRRIWRNLTNILEYMQDELIRDRIIVVEINVEGHDWNPHNHMVRHAALDGLVGIHGAQLTEAIWMKPGSLVVELLPYIPPGRWGNWVQTTHQPTPLGRIFKGTRLQHVGYPLDATSAPYCHMLNVTDCWEEDTMRWDMRDFRVDPEPVTRIVQKMMSMARDPESMLCEDYLKQAGHEFVLYNVNCRTSAQLPTQPNQFYWKEE